MNADRLIRIAIEIQGIKIIKFFFQILEIIAYWYYNKINKKGKKINYKFFGLLQILFPDGKLFTFYRRKKHAILVKTLDLNSEIDSKVYELTNKSSIKLFDINPLESKETIEYFYKQKIYTTHVPFNAVYTNKLITIKEFLNTEDYHYGSFDIQTSLNSSVVKKICSMETIWNIVKKYLNSNEVKIYTINTMLTKHSKKQNYVVNMHKDFDCANSITIFIYWTDVSKLNGATKLLPGNHLFQHDKRLRGCIGEPMVKYLEGKGGSVFAIDTWALHAGNPNITSPRLVTWIRFSSMPSRSYYVDKNYLFKNNLNEINHKFVSKAS